MAIVLKRRKGTGIVRKDGEDPTWRIVNGLAVASKSMESAIQTIREVATHYEYMHKTEEDSGYCYKYPDNHKKLTQGQLIDLRDAVKISRRNIEQVEGLISTLVYLSGVTIIDEEPEPSEANEMKSVEPKKEGEF